MDAGLFSGWNHRPQLLKPGWTKHILGATDEKTSTVVNFASRLEFQDGKRKTGTQKYHGRGTTHSHSLDFLENLDAIDLPSKISASMPPESDPFLRGLVQEAQLDDRRTDKRPVRDEASTFDKEAGELHLHHTQEDKDMHGHGGQGHRRAG